MSNARSVSAWVGEQLQPGDEVGGDGLFGDAWFREVEMCPVLAIGGGIGIVPVKAITEAALAEDPFREFHVSFGARTKQDLYLDRRFDGLARSYLNLMYMPVLSEPGESTYCCTGGVAEAATDDFDSLAGFRVYIAGPPPMVSTVVALVVARGIEPSRVHTDPYASDNDYSSSPGGH